MPKKGTTLALDTVSADAFAKYTGKPLTLAMNELEIEVILAGCTEKPEASGHDAKRTAFQMVFKAEKDVAHPLLELPHFNGTIKGHANGDLSDVLVNRIMRPIDMEEGQYLQVCFN